MPPPATEYMHGLAPHEMGQFARNRLATASSPLQYGLIMALQGWPITPDPLMLSTLSVHSPSTVERQRSAKPSNAAFALGVILFSINVRHVGVQKARKAFAHMGGQAAGTVCPVATLGHAASKDCVLEHFSKDALVGVIVVGVIGGVFVGVFVGVLVGVLVVVFVGSGDIVDGSGRVGGGPTYLNTVPLKSPGSVSTRFCVSKYTTSPSHASSITTWVLCS